MSHPSQPGSPGQEVYEAPRLEVDAAFHGAQGRDSGSVRGNFMCNNCSDWD